MRFLAEQRAPLHAAVAEAEAAVKDLERQLASAKSKLGELLTRWDRLERDLREARIDAEMGGHPPRSVTELKGELEVVSDQQESAEARSVGLQRAIASALEKIEAAKAALKEGQWAVIAKLAAEGVEQMKSRADTIQQDQRKLAALTFVAIDIGCTPAEVGSVVPPYLLYTEIVTTYGAATRRVWPEMGDRRTPRSLLEPQIAEIRQALDAL